MERGRSNTEGVGREGGHTAAVLSAEIERLVEENRRLYEHIGRLTHLAWLEEEAERVEQDAEEFRRRCEEARRKDESEKARAEAERLRREQAEQARRAAEEAAQARRAAEEARVREEQRKQREQAEKEAREREARQRRREEDARRKADEALQEKEREAERKRKAEEEAKREAERRARWQEWERRSNLSPRERYEEDWQAIAAGNFGEQLSFARFPWPLLERPGCHHEQEFPVNKIEEFLFLANLKTNSERCQLIRKELTRWHPHMFQTRVLPHLLDWDAQRIYEAAACVSRALVQLHEKFSQS